VTSGEHEDLLEGARLVGASLDSATVERLGRFVDLLVLWNRRLRLTGDRDPGLLLRKHIVDSLSVVPELPAWGLVADVGSGAGFPGLVLGCARPDLPLRLIEPRRRAVSFLSEVIRTVPLPEAQALELRGEDAAADPSLRGRFALVVSRALRLDVLVRLAAPLLEASGVVIAMQTPAMSEAKAGAVARSAGLDVARVRDYRLGGGELRRLITFEPRRRRIPI